MHKMLKLSTSTVALSGVLLVVACSSSSDGDGTTTGKASVPANAVVLDAANAETTVAVSVTTANALAFAAVGVEVAPAMGLYDALEAIQPRINRAKKSLKNSGADLVYGADLSEGGNCIVSGSYSGTGHSDTTSDSGSVTLNNCDDGDGFILNGNFLWSSTNNVSTGDYTDSVSGSFSVVSTGSLSFKFSFNGIDYAESGNYISEKSTVSKATFSVDFTGGGGFLVAITAPIVESVGGFSSCPESGTILITGANGSTAQGIYNGDNTMTVMANGVLVDAAVAPCYF